MAGNTNDKILLTIKYVQQRSIKGLVKTRVGSRSLGREGRVEKGEPQSYHYKQYNLKVFQSIYINYKVYNTIPTITMNCDYDKRMINCYYQLWFLMVNLSQLIIKYLTIIINHSPLSRCTQNTSESKKSKEHQKKRKELIDTVRAIDDLYLPGPASYLFRCSKGLSKTYSIKPSTQFKFLFGSYPS